MAVTFRATTRWFFIEVLTVVLLLAYSNGAVAISSPRGIERDQNLSDTTLDATPNGRNFRHDATTMTRNPRNEIDEERAPAIETSRFTQGVITSISKLLEMLPFHLQLRYWQLLGKTPTEMFALLHLEHVKDNLFENPAFIALETFVVRGSARSPKHANALMFLAMISTYGDYELAMILAKAKRNPVTKDSVDKYRPLLLEYWSSSEKTLDEIFNLLKLNDAGDGLLEHPLLPTWVAYVYHKEKDPVTVIKNTFLKQPRFLHDKADVSEAAAIKLAYEHVENYVYHKEEDP